MGEVAGRRLWRVWMPGVLGGVAIALAGAAPAQASMAPTVATGAASAVSQTSGTLNATVNPNGAEVSDCHFDYGTTLLYGSSVPCSALPGAGTSSVAVSGAVGGLSAETTYYFRIVATNAGGTEYGVDEALTTLPEPPMVVTEPASAVAQTSATLHALVDPEGTPVRSCRFEYGTTNSYGSSAPCTPSPGSEESPVPVSAAIAGLSTNTTYHFRISATNSGGTSRGSDETFKTPTNTPTVVTEPASAIALTTATLNATVDPNGGEVSKCEFEYGTSEAYGQTAPCSAQPGSGTSPVAVSAAIGSLAINTTYHFRISATNAAGTSRGSDEMFRTLPNAPAVVTKPASPIALTTATLNATVDPNGGEVSKCEFEYGTSEAYGQTAPCSAQPGSGTSPVTVSAAIGSLAMNTTYHFRISATNAGGTSKGSDQPLTTLGGLCGPTYSPGGQGTPGACNWYGTSTILPAGQQRAIFFYGGVGATNLVLTSSLGEVSCKTVGWGTIENPLGGGAGIGKIFGMGFYSCSAPQCEKEAQEAVGKPGRAAVTAVNLPWNESLSEGGSPQSVRDHIGVPFSGPLGAPKAGEVDVKVVCEVIATKEQIKTTSFEGALEPEIGIGPGPAPGLNAASEFRFSGSSTGVLESPVGKGTYTGLLKYAGWQPGALEVW
jgi:phosphodiesterase/alkaline phosphatase D-like protein